MDSQLSIFTPDTPGRLAVSVPHNSTPGSIEAARKVEPRANTDAGRILAMLRAPMWANVGANQEQISDTLGLPRATVCARVSELENGGWLRKSGSRAMRSGVRAAVYFVREGA